ncbi:MAG TPA: AI-2E family transporter [Nitrospinota bacterium]|nr:AI-2E family transporter [Nitrospinota bacterium]
MIIQNNLKKSLILTISIAAVLYFIFISRDILMPFVIAMLLAYILDPLVDRLQKFKIPRIMAIILLTIVLVSLLALFSIIVFPLIKIQVDSLIEDMPLYIERTKKMIIPILDRIAAKHSDKVQLIIEEGMKRLSTFPLRILDAITSFIFNALSTFVNIVIVAINLLIIPVATFYLLKDFDRIKEKIKEYLPPSSKESIVEKIREIDTILGAFIKGQLTVCLILAVLYSMGLYIINIPMGVLIGIVAGFANIIPYLGLVVGIVPALFLAFLQFKDFEHIIGVILVFGIVQFFEGNFITPRIVGNKVGLHPVVIMIAILVGAKFFGFIGILLAVPIAAILKVFISSGLVKYKNSSLFNQT